MCEDLVSRSLVRFQLLILNLDFCSMYKEADWKPTSSNFHIFPFFLFFLCLHCDA